MTKWPETRFPGSQLFFQVRKSVSFSHFELSPSRVFTVGIIVVTFCFFPFLIYSTQSYLKLQSVLTIMERFLNFKFAYLVTYSLGLAMLAGKGKITNMDA